MTLGGVLGWDREKFENNQTLQDNALEEMHIPTYNEFSELQFWDVMQGLCKVHMVNLELQEERKMRRKARKLDDIPDPEQDEDGLLDLSSDDDEEEQIDQNDPDAAGKLAIKLENDRIRQHKEYERKIELRLEFEFEYLDRGILEVMDVEEV